MALLLAGRELVAVLRRVYLFESIDFGVCVGLFIELSSLLSLGRECSASKAYWVLLLLVA